MPPRSRSALQRKAKKTKLSVVKLSTNSSRTGLSQKRFNPLTAFDAQNQLHELPSSSPKPLLKKTKRNEKVIELSPDEETSVHDDYLDDRLWVDIHGPYTETDLAIHARKVDNVRRWFLEAFREDPSGKLRKYRRILALTGPSGAGKTAMVRVLSREMGFKILEWRNAIGESTFSKLEAFLNRATSCSVICYETSPTAPTSSLRPTIMDQESDSFPTTSKYIILFEDLPNILHAGTQVQFHTAIRLYIEGSSQSASSVPLVIIMSDATLRGETRDEILTSGGAGGHTWNQERTDILDIRAVLPRDLLTGPYVTQIRFNPIAPTLMKKALTGLIDRHFKSKSSLSSVFIPPSKDIIDTIVESANGDIRSAIMTLQFSCIPGKQSHGRKGGSCTTIPIEALTRRESGLALFHLIGKVMYNKRLSPGFSCEQLVEGLTRETLAGKGDPLSASATAKDIRKEKELDTMLKDPPKLPWHLQEHERRASRVDVDSLYTESPIDSSLFSLYIHQNYTQFCNELEECNGVIDWLSWVDSSGGEMWYQANPHRFHLLALGTLHSLPSPVSRRSQKIFKPDYFDNMTKERDAWDAVNDTCNWMMVHGGIGLADSILETSRWSKLEVALELGAILKLKQAQKRGGRDMPPSSHSLFSKLAFTSGDGHKGQQVDEDVVDDDEFQIPIEVNVGMSKRCEDDSAMGDWLDDDDIEEF